MAWRRRASREKCSPWAGGPRERTGDFTEERSDLFRLLEAFEIVGFSQGDRLSRRRSMSVASGRGTAGQRWLFGHPSCVASGNASSRVRSAADWSGRGWHPICRGGSWRMVETPSSTVGQSFPRPLATSKEEELSTLHGSPTSCRAIPGLYENRERPEICVWVTTRVEGEKEEDENGSDHERRAGSTGPGRQC